MVEPNAVQRVKRTVAQVLVALGAVLAGLQAVQAAGYQVPGATAVAAVLGGVVVFVTAVQNAWDAKVRAPWTDEPQP